MTISEFLRDAQYSQLQVGNRLLTAGYPGWVVREFIPNSNSKTKEILRTESEDEAIEELIKGEPLYKDLLKKCM